MQNQKLSFALCRGYAWKRPLRRPAHAIQSKGCERSGENRGMASYNALFLVSLNLKIRKHNQEHGRVDATGGMLHAASLVCRGSCSFMQTFGCTLYSTGVGIFFVYCAGFGRLKRRTSRVRIHAYYVFFGQLRPSIHFKCLLIP